MTVDWVDTDLSVETVDVHSAGQPVRIVTSGLDHVVLDGDTVQAKRDEFADSYDQIRQFLNTEPRGHDNLVTVIPVEPEHDDADAGAFFADNTSYLEMCGDGTIGLITGFIESGRLPAKEAFKLETPIGLAEIEVEYTENSNVKRVDIQGIPAYHHSTETVELTEESETNPISVSIAYAGHFYALVNIDDTNLEFHGRETDFERIADYGMELRQTIGTVQEKLAGEEKEIAVTMFYQEHEDRADQNVIVYGDRAIGRAPCGTGTSAKMAMMYEDGNLSLDEPYPHESILGTQYRGRLLDVSHDSGFPVLSTEVGGTAHITGQHTFLRDAADDLLGYRI
ncbi:proline racemase family protein [Halorussus salinisoli]|uniref:proline racemase family protein n=1 Tax=Halorussus salinisoli TaxID=2558242 RepID=UPI0010C243D2|nr:proline racemase family protein [Halorussus salinisoli]